VVVNTQTLDMFHAIIANLDIIVQEDLLDKHAMLANGQLEVKVLVMMIVEQAFTV
jgi:hypothetical protein